MTGRTDPAALAMALHYDFSAALLMRAASRDAATRTHSSGRRRKQWRSLLDDALQARFREVFGRSPCGGAGSRRAAVAWARTLYTVVAQRVSGADDRAAARELSVLKDETIITYLRNAARRRRAAQDCAPLPPILSFYASSRGSVSSLSGMEPAAPLIGPELMTKAEVCDLLRMSPRTFETKIVNAGRITPVRPSGGKVLFRKSDVIALIAGSAG
jgi:excisionase family DNA binding protein